MRDTINKAPILLKNKCKHSCHLKQNIFARSVYSGTLNVLYDYVANHDPELYKLFGSDMYKCIIKTLRFKHSNYSLILAVLQTTSLQLPITSMIFSHNKTINNPLKRSIKQS